MPDPMLTAGETTLPKTDIIPALAGETDNSTIVIQCDKWFSTHLPE